MFPTILSLISVAVLWGATNPLIRKGSVGIKNINERSPLKRFLFELKYLVTNWKYMLPMVINQSGSLIYFVTVRDTDLSLAVPFTNSLTFVFTALTGWILGEKAPNKSTLFGMFLIFLGAIFCFLDKL